MFRLSVTEGRQQGTWADISAEPFRVGKGANDDWRLDDRGVWEGHAVFELKPGGLPRVRRSGEGSLAVNAEPVASAARLRDGDRITLGATVLYFTRTPAVWRRLVLLDVSAWSLFGAVVALELGLLAWLLSSLSG